MYHRSCYRNICRIEKQVVNPEEIQEKRVREECFNDLKTIVQMKVIENGEFMRLGSVADNYRKLQETAGIEPKGILVKNVKSRLKNALGKKVAFFQRSDGLPEVIYGNENVPFKDSTSESSDAELVKKTAKLLRQEHLSSPDVCSSWPPTEREVLSAKYISPPLVESFLSTLLTSSGSKSSRLTRIISSLAQDLK